MAISMTEEFIKDALVICTTNFQSKAISAAKVDGIYEFRRANSLIFTATISKTAGSWYVVISRVDINPGNVFEIVEDFEHTFGKSIFFTLK